MSSSSDSDTDEEEKQRLQESVSGYNIAKSQKQEDKKQVKPTKKSLRNPENDEIRESVLNTTPEFRNFIAKKLDSYFDGVIKDKDGSTNTSVVQKESDKDEHNGIKLLRNSRNILPDAELVPTVESRSERKDKKKRKKYVSSSSSDDDEEMQRLRSAAVTSDFVTSISAQISNGEENEIPSETQKKKKKK